MNGHEPDSRRGAFLAGNRVPRLLLGIAAGLAMLIGSLAIIDARSAETPVSALHDRSTAADEISTDAAGWATIGLEAVEDARASGDPSFYARADAAIDRALALDPVHPDALAGAGALAAARHQFTEAERFAQRALESEPRHAAALGVLSDSQIELGSYQLAFATIDRLVQLHPGLSSYARAAYAFELQGAPADAIRAFQLAADAAATAEAVAFANFHIGELHRTSGRPALARAAYERAAAADPTSILGPHGLARLAAAAGDRAHAIDRYRQLAERTPLPEIVIELAELCTLARNRACVAEQLELLAVQERLLRANDVDIDLEQALFNITRGRNLAGGLASLRAEWRRRQGIAVADALAWSLHANGKSGEALRYADIALRLGTRNATFLAHRGFIKRALGRTDARADLERALDFGPSPMWAVKIRAALGRP